MYTPYNIFNPELKKYQAAGVVTGPDLKVGTVFVKDGRTYKVTALRSQTDFDVEDITDKTNVAVDKSSVKKYKDRGIDIDFGNVGETQYEDMQGAEATAGRFGDATKNEQGFKDSWKGIYPDYDKLVESLPKRYTNNINPEVKKFQKWINESYIPNSIKTINEQRVKAGYKPFTADENKALQNDLIADYGFDPSKKGKGFDGKYGTVTSSKRPLNYTIDPAANSVTTTEDGKNTAQQITKGTQGPPGDIPEVGWFPQDVNNLYGALADWTGTKKYMPWMPQADFQYYDPTFYDPSRALANINEQTNISAQGLNAYGSGNAFAAALAAYQGKAAEQAANTLGQYENLNVGIANDAAKYNAEVDTKQALYNAQKTGNYYDQTTIANQQFDNATKQNRRNTINAFNTGITNRAMANTLNYMNPYEYFMDPATGGIRFNKNNVPSNLDDTYKADAQRREEQLSKFLGDTKWSSYDNDAKFEIYDRLYPSEFSPGSYRKPKGTNPQQDDMYMRMMQMMMGSGAYPG